MCEKLMMRISTRFPLPVLIIGFVFVFTLAVLWLRRMGQDTTYKSGQSDNVETLLNLNYKDINEVSRNCIGEDVTLDNFHELLSRWSKTRTFAC
ncbi:Hypothetical predicted protein, partial [Paramuricea clavata]